MCKTYIQFPKVCDGEINIQRNNNKRAKHKNGLRELEFIVITEKISSA